MCRHAKCANCGKSIHEGGREDPYDDPYWVHCETNEIGCHGPIARPKDEENTTPVKTEVNPP